MRQRDERLRLQEEKEETGLSSSLSSPPVMPLPSAAGFEPNCTQNNNPSPLNGEIHSHHQPMFSIRVSICFSFRVWIGAFAIRVLICFMFSVLIGPFAIMVRFVTVFMYLDLSQRSLSDNDCNEMVVLVSMITERRQISRLGRRESSLVSSAS